MPVLYVIDRSQLERPEPPVSVRRPNGVDCLCVRTLCGRMLPVEAKQLDPVSAIKGRLGPMLGLPPTRLRLLFQGAELSDWCDLASYSISTAPNSTSTLFLLVTDPPLDAERAVGISIGCMMERVIDGMWFMAQVVRCHGAQGNVIAVDLQYMDDGN